MTHKYVYYATCRKYGKSPGARKKKKENLVNGWADAAAGLGRRSREGLWVSVIQGFGFWHLPGDRSQELRSTKGTRRPSVWPAPWRNTTLGRGWVRETPTEQQKWHGTVCLGLSLGRKKKFFWEFVIMNLNSCRLGGPNYTAWMSRGNFKIFYPSQRPRGTNQKRSGLLWDWAYSADCTGPR